MDTCSTNPPSGETKELGSENARMKKLLEVGYYKSLLGHEALNEILSKQFKNSRKEGLGFTRNINVDGTYWRPEHYCKTTFVLGRGKNVDSSNFNGHACKDYSAMHTTFDTNNKIFKNQRGEAFATLDQKEKVYHPPIPFG